MKNSWTADQRIRDYGLRVNDIQDDFNYETDVLEALLGRSRLAEVWASLSPAQQSEVERADGELVKLHNRVAEVIPSGAGHPRSHWWWHLNEGPQVREEANARLRRVS